MERIGGGAFFDDVFTAIGDIAPGAAVPMIVAGEVENSLAGDVEGDVIVVGKLVKVMAGVSAAIAAGAVVSAPHVSADADTLLRPFFPLQVSIGADGDGGRFGGGGWHRIDETECAGEDRASFTN